jgi:predicted MFS family arabinose efflux permease
MAAAGIAVDEHPNARAPSQIRNRKTQNGTLAVVVDIATSPTSQSAARACAAARRSRGAGGSISQKRNFPRARVSRAVGPALGGVTIAALGIAAPFWINAASDLAIVGALVWWQPALQNARALPAERFSNAVIAGLRYARYTRPLHATLFRAVAFYLFASAYWALLPLVARTQISGGPGLYGFMLGAIGAGAVAGSFALPWLKRTLGPDRLVVGGTLSTILALLLFAVAQNAATVLGASVIAGAGWVAVLATLNISAQVALPEWVRGRGLALYLTVFSAP